MFRYVCKQVHKYTSACCQNSWQEAEKKTPFKAARCLRLNKLPNHLSADIISLSSWQRSNRYSPHKHMQTHNHLVHVERTVCVHTHTRTRYLQRTHTLHKNTDRGRQLLSNSAGKLQLLLKAAAPSPTFHLQARESYWIYNDWESDRLPIWR